LATKKPKSERTGKNINKQNLKEKKKRKKKALRSMFVLKFFRFFFVLPTYFFKIHLKTNIYRVAAHLFAGQTLIRKKNS